MKYTIFKVSGILLKEKNINETNNLNCSQKIVLINFYQPKDGIKIIHH